MSDFSSMNREYKKNQLRSRVITTGDTPRQTERFVRMPEYDGQQDEDQEEELRSAQRRARRRRLIIAVVLACLAAAALGAFYWYMRYYQLKTASVVWERQMEQTEGTYTGYASFGSNVLKYTRDGAAYIDDSGKDVWIQSYEMNAPIVAVSGDYAAIADQQGNAIYICDKTGCLGIATTVMPISKVTISSKGMVAAVVEDQTSSYVYYYQKDGTEMKIYIRGFLKSESEEDEWGVGYVLDTALSPNGNVLMGAYYYIQGGSLKNRVAFYNFSEVGKNAENRMVGGFHDAYEDSMIAKVACLNDTYAVAFSDNSLSFYSLRDEMSPAMIQLIPVQEEIRSVFYNENYVGIIVDDVTGENEYRMDVYKADGTKAFSEAFSYAYTHVGAEGDLIFLYNEDSCRIYNRYGNLKYEGTFDFTLVKMTKGRLPNQIIVTGPQVMQELILR